MSNIVKAEKLELVESQGGERSDMELTQELTILNPAGLHARPAALVVERAKAMSSSVKLSVNGKTADAKSILSVGTPSQGDSFLPS